MEALKVAIADDNENVFVVLGISIVLMLGLMFLLRAVIGKKQN